LFSVYKVYRKTYLNLVKIWNYCSKTTEKNDGSKTKELNKFLLILVLLNDRQTLTNFYYTMCSLHQIFTVINIDFYIYQILKLLRFGNYSYLVLTSFKFWS
jgi:hypothetical protein